MRKLFGLAFGAALFATPAMALPWSHASTSNKAVNGACGSSNGGSFSSAPTSGLCNAGNNTTVTGTGPWSWTCTGFHSGTTANCSASVATTGYAAWSNYPQDPNFFPIALFWQALNTSIPGYSSFLNAMKGTGMNVLIILNGASGGIWGPSAFGVDSAGFLAQIANAGGIYILPQVNSATTIPCSSGCIGNIPPNNTDANSVASYQALASATTGAAHTIIGWFLVDEPTTGSCTRYPMSGIPAQVADYHAFDTTRPFYFNSQNYVFNSGFCSPTSLNTNAMAAIDLGSMDQYPLTNPWTVQICCGTSPSSPGDTLWVQGWAITQMMAVRPAGAPFWTFVDSGSDNLGFAASGPGFTCASNFCSNGTYTVYQRGPAPLVNAEVWMSIINGATGIEWFCEDTTAAYAYCIGQGNSAGALAAQANVTYVNSSLKTYAAIINSTIVGICTMITGTVYTNHNSSCTNGILTMATGTSTVPGSALAKSYGGATYLFAQPARNGSAAFTFTLSGLAGKVATVVYDSNSQYDSANTSVGATFTLNGSAQFTDTFGANSDNYQVKIYKVQ